MSARHRRCPRPDKVTYPSQWQAIHAVRRSPFLVRAYKNAAATGIPHRTERLTPQ